MPSFSDRSKSNLGTCHPDLIRLFDVVVQNYDCTVIEGHRTLDRQAELFRTGHTKLKNGKHNALPSLAVDVVPYPVDWSDRNKFYHFGGYVLACAIHLGIKIRWGGDWNSNLDLKDQSFFDLPHFELRG